MPFTQSCLCVYLPRREASADGFSKFKMSSTTKRFKAASREEEEETTTSGEEEEERRIRPTQVYLEFPPPPILDSASSSSSYALCIVENGKEVARVEPEFTHQVFPEDDLEDEELEDDADLVEEIPVDFYIRYSSSWNASYFVRPVSDDLVDQELVEALSAKLEASFAGGPFLTRGTTALEDEPWNLAGSGILLESIANPKIMGGDIEFYFVDKVCESKAGRAILARAQALSTWFIETSEPVSYEKADSRWSLMYALLPNKQGLAAYATIYPFVNMARKHQPLVLRLCQIVVLPTLRGSGIGKSMLRLLYDMGRKKDLVYEINVEDPCPAFQRLRDQLDVADLSRLSLDFGTSRDDFRTDAPGFEAKAREAREGLKITWAQLYRAIDVIRLAYLLKHCCESTSDLEEIFCSETEPIKSYRVDVKKRLHRTHLAPKQPGEVTRLSPEEIKSKLAELFRHVVNDTLMPLVPSARLRSP